MKEIEEGVFDLETTTPCTITPIESDFLLSFFGNGAEGGVASVIVGLSMRHEKWVGVSRAKMLSLMVTFRGKKMGILAHQRQEIQQLAEQIARDMLPFIREAMDGKCSWLKKVGDNPSLAGDEIFALVVKEVDNTFSLN